MLFLFTRDVDVDNFFYIFYVDVDSLVLWHYHHGSLSPVPPASLTLIDADGIELSETAGDYPFALIIVTWVTMTMMMVMMMMLIRLAEPVGKLMHWL